MKYNYDHFIEHKSTTQVNADLSIKSFNSYMYFDMLQQNLQHVIFSETQIY